MDLFEEMDEMFARLFFRMDREFIDGTSREYGVRIALRDNGEDPKIPDMADDAASLSCVPGEPVAEVHRIGNEVKVIADLPGITEELLRLDVRGAHARHRCRGCGPPLPHVGSTSPGRSSIAAEDPEKRCA
jgi:HSP20 family molecular chaperone IbpA